MLSTDVYPAVDTHSSVYSISHSFTVERCLDDSCCVPIDADPGVKTFPTGVLPGCT